MVIRPPRALWVPFPLGRPCGAPDDPGLQARVLAAALGLLERSEGPVLEDYPEDAPAVIADDDAAPAEAILACPVPRRDDGSVETSTRAQLAAEVAFLRPWHARAMRTRGRTTVGVSGLTPEAAADLLATWVDSGDAAGIPTERLKLAIDDLRAFCLEAGSAQPGGAAGGPRVERWFWWETAIGCALRDAHPQALASSDPALRLMAKVLMIPTGQRESRPSTGPGADG